MPWVKLDENLPHHPKFIAISPAAAWLYVCGLAYCNRFLTDGLIPAKALHSVAPTIRNAVKLVDQLVTVKLWDKDCDGWRVHDYADYQPTAAKVREHRLAVARRVADWREKRVGNAVTNGLRPQDVTHGVTPPPSRPVPSRPVEAKETTALSGERPTLPNPDRELREHAKAILAFLNERTGRAYRTTPTNLGFIVGRLKSGASVEDCRSIVARKAREWLPDPKMTKYLRPETLFNATKFESYIGELGS